MYICFLDSDDAAHPMLLEEMIKQTQQHGVQMVFCHSVELEDHEMNAALSEASAHDVRPDWRIGDGLESERWFHIDYLDALGGTGGLIPRELIGSLRFDTSLAMGEDGLIKNQLFAWQVPVAYTSMPWYFWRINYQGLCHNISLAVGARAAEKARGSGVSSIAREIWNTPKYGITCTRRVCCGHTSFVRKQEMKRCALRSEIVPNESTRTIVSLGFFAASVAISTLLRALPSVRAGFLDSESNAQ